MSRFANPEARERLALGPCECPGTPHDEDWIELRSEIGAEDFAFLEASSSVDGLARILVGWNLLDHDGSAATPDRDHVARLYGDNFEPIGKWIADHLKVVTSLPNPPAARSRTTSRTSGSPRIRTLQKVG